MRGIIERMTKQILPQFYHSPSQTVSRLSHLLSILPKKSNTLLITGAGISTSCGIPDYRSPTSTRLQSGPGQYHQPRDPSTFNPLAVSPSYTHQAITSLVRSGLIKTVLSQNVDNLHLKARLPSSRLIEVHGNICKEYCEGCGRLYYRNYCCRDRLRPKDSDHYNGRNCLCGGRLLDTLVFFGQGYNPSTKSLLQELCPDLILVAGSSLTIPSLQRLIKRSKVQTHVINIQKTPLEEGLVASQVHCEVDTAFRWLAEKLGVQVGEGWRVGYRVAVTEREREGGKGYEVRFHDFEMTEVEVVKEVEIRFQNGKVERKKTGYPEVPILPKNGVKEIELYLHAYHGEKPLVLTQAQLHNAAHDNKILNLQWNGTRWDISE